MVGLPENIKKEGITMKGFKLAFILIAVFAVAIGFSNTADAMHGGGVGHCDACHSMHNSADNPIGVGRGGVETGFTAGNSILTKGSDASSTCLNCHKRNGGYGVLSSDGSNMNAGGDFWWVANDYQYPGRSEGSFNTDPGMNRGHNIIAADYGLTVVDEDNLTAPGGTYAAGLLGCTSCHDAHGQVAGGTKASGAPISVSGSYGAEDPIDGSVHGNYRLLGDSAYEAGGESDEYDFSVDAPIARSDGSGGALVDYGSGMSEWCSNCHDFAGETNMHIAGDTEHLGSGISTNYNSYIATGDWIGGGGNSANANDGLVPFERGIDDGSLLNEESTVGPDGNSNVMCLTCHRAHGSAYSNAGRWDFEAELLADSNVLNASDLPALAVPNYARGVEVDFAAFGEHQRSLCNKCHAQD